MKAWRRRWRGGRFCRSPAVLYDTVCPRLRFYKVGATPPLCRVGPHEHEVCSYLKYASVYGLLLNVALRTRVTWYTK